MLLGVESHLFKISAGKDYYSNACALGSTDKIFTAVVKTNKLNCIYFTMEKSFKHNVE